MIDRSMSMFDRANKAIGFVKEFRSANSLANPHLVEIIEEKIMSAVMFRSKIRIFVDPEGPAFYSQEEAMLKATFCQTHEFRDYIEEVVLEDDDPCCLYDDDWVDDDFSLEPVTDWEEDDDDDGDYLLFPPMGDFFEEDE